MTPGLSKLKWTGKKSRLFILQSLARQHSAQEIDAPLSAAEVFSFEIALFRGRCSRRLCRNKVWKPKSQFLRERLIFTKNVWDKKVLEFCKDSKKSKHSMSVINISWLNFRHSPPKFFPKFTKMKIVRAQITILYTLPFLTFKMCHNSHSLK